MNRRRWITGLGASAIGTLLAGCGAVTQSPTTKRTLHVAEDFNRRVQRLLAGRKGLAREFAKADISPDFKANGTTYPSSLEYHEQAKLAFPEWRLVVDGLVNNPLSLSLAQVRAMPSRTQITRHDCVEGWSSIGEWTGAKLGPILQMAGLKEEARYIVFHCADELGGAPYYESIDLIDAFHPQSIIAYLMNGQSLPIKHGAPLRLRVERQLGYKHAKYIQRIEAVESFAHIEGGKGGFWPDRGYEWYAGI